MNSNQKTIWNHSDVQKINNQLIKDGQKAGNQEKLKKAIGVSVGVGLLGLSLVAQANQSEPQPQSKPFCVSNGTQRPCQKGE
jgi:hypothetical protein